MMGRGGYYVCSIVVLSLLQNCATAAPVSDSTDVGKRLSGQFLFKLGTDNNNLLLRLLGQTFMNYDNDVKDVQRLAEKLCQLHPCTEWESWTKCPVTFKGQFGMTTRSRRCNRNDSICAKKESNDWPTKDSRVCEGSCPETYNFTNGYCLKLFTTKMAQYDAQEVCEKDGGHLVNIDTKVKSDAFHVILKDHGIIDEAVWINGNRTHTGGTWQYTYGSVPDFANWYTTNTEPSNRSDELCKIEQFTQRQWCDRACSELNQYVCEVI